MEEIRKGKFIVIEGGDGSGKGTQSKLLLQYLEEKQIPHASLDFPKYDSFFGKLVAKFLRGELGSLEEVSPYLASLPFALDRNDSKKEIETYLQEGKVVLANRYVSSNLAHQGGKLPESEQQEFLDWLTALEYSVHRIPKPDLTIYLYMPWEKAKELTSQKESRDYLQGKDQDIQESNNEHRIATEKMYQFLASQDSSWKKINCVENGTIISMKQIHNNIINILENSNII